MLRESGVIPCFEIQDFKVDLVYSKYSVKQGKDVIMSINEERFRDMLKEIADLKFPLLGKHEALVKLIRMYIWPYLLLQRKEI